MLANYSLLMPHVTYGGDDPFGRVPEILKQVAAARVAVFSGKTVRRTGLLDPVFDAITDYGAEYQVLDDLPAEPSYLEAQRLVDQCREYGADFIIGAGGGSVMDTAKLASILMTDQYGIKELLDTPTIATKCVKTLMIPTTAGTGAEATPNAIVGVPEKLVKVGIVNNDMIADYVILNPAMIRDLPRSIAAATGVDALAHAIECYTSNKANPFSDIFALRALGMIFDNIEAACDDPEATEAKTNMLIASYFAGIAITASGTTAVHALSYPLGGRYHIAHGVSNAILLAPVMRFNEPAARQRLALAYDSAIRGEAQSPEDKSAAVISRIEEIVRHLDIPTSLAGFGVGREDLEDLVVAGMGVQRLLVNNMRPLTAFDARNIYMEVL